MKNIDTNEEVTNLMFDIDNLKKEIKTRDVIISNLVHEINSTKTVKSQVRRIFRTINNNILDRFDRMRRREVIDHSQEAEEILEQVSDKDTAEVILEKLNRHDHLMAVRDVEPHTLTTILGEILFFIFNSIRRAVKVIVFGLIRILKSIKRRLK